MQTSLERSTDPMGCDVGRDFLRQRHFATFFQRGVQFRWASAGLPRSRRLMNLMTNFTGSLAGRIPPKHSCPSANIQMPKPLGP